MASVRKVRVSIEADICRQFIVPKLQVAGWDAAPCAINEQRTFTNGRVVLVGNQTRRGRRKRADYILRYRPDCPIAVGEADLSFGLRQGISGARVRANPRSPLRITEVTSADVEQAHASLELGDERSVLPRAFRNRLAHRSRTSMPGEQGTEARRGSSARSPLLLGDDHHRFFAVTSHTLRFSRQRAVEELRELGTGFV